MAIWPFGRGNKNKRHTIQVSPDEAAALQSSLDQQQPPPAEPTLGRKPSLQPARRQNNRLSRNGDNPDPVTRSSSQRQRPMSLVDHRSSQMSSDREHPAALPRPLSQTESLMKTKNGPNKLRRRLSKRKAHEIMREREIRMLSSMPIDIPRRTGHPGDYNMTDHRRKKQNGRLDRHQSDISLSFRDSAASSLLDLTDPYTFKVNAFAALTPRPVVRYVEAPRAPTARSSNPPGSGRPEKDRLQALTTSEEDLYHSKRRMNELADSLDASTLRELMERDRRRREKKQIDDQERLRRKLQERADAQHAEEERAAQEALAAARASAEATTKPEEPAETEEAQEPATDNVESPVEESRVESKGSDVVGTDSLDESARVIGNIDDSSIRESSIRDNSIRDSSIRDVPKLATRPSFAPSHDMGMSRTTLSPSHSSLRHGLSSPSHSQTFGMGSNSDLSERRLSDTSGRRAGTITSLFRRGSSRIKRRYRERFQDSSPEVSNNASHESFYRIQTQASPPPAASIIPPRTFIPTGTVIRSQSKFTEHFGDEPMSPPDSRLQSPDIPEEVAESSLENNEGTFLRGPTPSASVDIINPRRRHHQSWTESMDAESDNVPLSQSLASIDSEGSWMSGQFFRRMNQRPGSPMRPNIGSFGPGMDGAADTPDERHSIDSRGASSNIMGEPEMDAEPTAPDATKPAEMWHSEVGRRPMIVNPASRPKSNQGALRCIPSLSPISAEEDYSPVSPLEEDPAEVNFPHRIVSFHGEIDHV